MPDPVPAYFCSASAVLNTTEFLGRCVATADEAKLLCIAGATAPASGQFSAAR
ncbi:MAG: hypothetical protein U0802_05685 [Candidatus Binatia bacterium]